jgi:hypothetical protein
MNKDSVLPASGDNLQDGDDDDGDDHDGGDGDDNDAQEDIGPAPRLSNESGRSREFWLKVAQGKCQGLTLSNETSLRKARPLPRCFSGNVHRMVGGVSHTAVFVDCSASLPLFPRQHLYPILAKYLSTESVVVSPEMAKSAVACWYRRYFVETAHHLYFSLDNLLPSDRVSAGLMPLCDSGELNVHLSRSHEVRGCHLCTVAVVAVVNSHVCLNICRQNFTRLL